MNAFDRCYWLIGENLQDPRARREAEEIVCKVLSGGGKLPSSDMIVRVIANLKNNTPLDPMLLQVLSVITSGLTCLATICMAKEQMQNEPRSVVPNAKAIHGE